MFAIGDMVSLSSRPGCSGKVWKVYKIDNDGGLMVRNITDPRTKGPILASSIVRFNKN